MKKFVQARLPFKVLSSDGTPEAVESADARKRKLPQGEEHNKAQSSKRRSSKLGGKEENAKNLKEIINSTASKKAVVAKVVVSDSSDNESEHNRKENLKTTAEKQNQDSSDVLSDDVDLIASTDEDESIVVATKTPPKTVETTPVQQKGRKSATPKGAKKSTPKSASKLQIKLPLGSSKKNKRKPNAKINTNKVDSQEEPMSDDIEIIEKELHPEKRLKLDVCSNKTEEKEMVEDKKTGEIEETANNIGKTDKEEKIAENNDRMLKISTQKDGDIKNKKNSSMQSEEIASKNNINQSIDISSTSSELDADTEAEQNLKTKKEEQQKLENVSSPKTTGDSSNVNVNKIQKKNLTPKQQKLLEQRLKAREEKERKIQEERQQKQREKEERELAKKREREEKEEQRRKEREEKEEQRRKEREEKEKKRLAEIELKNEEKRKRNEAKEEEIRKKEEERKRKEQEKEEAELKKKKAALAFTKFFSRPAQDTAGDRAANQDVKDENREILAFRPFQVKGDMKLAPIVRKKLTDEERVQLATYVEGEHSKMLYLDELKSGAIKPYKWIRPIQNENELMESKQEKYDDNDVVIVEDELERAGQAIVQEHNLPIERFRAKFYKFDENRRPPYFGTWRKKSKIITARRPFAQDKQFFDYEVDSDEEWEEEEPGESLDGSEDDKEKESEDEDYEVDNEWFVPHGHLSEEEMQNEDDLGENNDREAQKAKLQILQQEFAQEMKKKTEKIKPRLIGCIWVDENGNQPELCPKIIWDTLNLRAILCAETPILEEPKSTTDKNNEIHEINEKSSGGGEVKRKPITLTEDMLKQLVKLVHGNSHSKSFLIKEFIAYIEANEESVRNGDVRVPLKSAVREKIDEFAKWQVVEGKSSKINESSEDNKSIKPQKNKKKLCWVVSKHILQNMNLDTNDLSNNWEYILQPRVLRREVQKEECVANNEDSNENSEASVEQISTNEPTTPLQNKSKLKSDIKKFAKVLTAEEKAQQLQKTPSVKEIAMTSPASSNKSRINLNSSNRTPTVKKRVPLLVSVARGQSISTPDKNARISQFLKTINDAKEMEKKENNSNATPMETDCVILE